MTKTLTEQWREGTLSMGYYYVSTPPSYGGEAIKYLDDDCSFGLGEDIIQEVLAPAPDYYDCKRLMNDSIELDKAKIKIYELVSKTEQLEKKLAIATKALEFYAELPTTGAEARQAIKEMEGVK